MLSWSIALKGSEGALLSRELNLKTIGCRSLSEVLSQFAEPFLSVMRHKMEGIEAQLSEQAESRQVHTLQGW